MLIAEHTTTIEACRFCFMCRHVCTVGVVSGKESDTPRGKGLILFKILKGHADYSPDLVETLYRCCLCGLCETWCKADCHPPAAVLAARRRDRGPGQGTRRGPADQGPFAPDGQPLWSSGRSSDSRRSATPTCFDRRPRSSTTWAATRPTGSRRSPRHS